MSDVKGWLAEKFKNGVVTERDPAIPLGDHVLALRVYDMFETREMGTALRANFVVLETNSNETRPGAIVGHLWFMSKTGLDGKYQAGAANKFIEELTGADSPEKCAEFCQALIDKEQPGRGYKIRCHARPGKPMKNDASRNYTNITWEKVEQTQDEIKQNRAVIERDYPVKDKAPPAPVAAPPVIAAPAGFGGFGKR